MAELGDLEYANAGSDYGSAAWSSAERLVFYDFEPRTDDCPLLLRAPHDLRIDALHRAEREAKEAKEARYAALKAGNKGSTVAA